MNLRKFILDALRKKFEGVDDKVLNRIARTAVKTVNTEDDATQFVEDLTIQQVIDSYSDSRVTEGIASYEKKYGLKDGKKAEEGDDKTDDPDDDKKAGKEDKKDDDKDGKGKDDVPAWAKALMDGQNRLNERLDGFEKGKVADTRKSKLSELIKDAPDKLKARIEKRFARATFKDDADFEEWLDELGEEIEEADTAESNKDGLVNPPKGGSKGGNIKEYKPSQAMLDRVNRNMAETVQSVLQGMPKTETANQ